MILRWLMLALLAVLLGPGVLRAQTKPDFQKPLLRDVFDARTAVSINNDKMYEDIEIMRRILDRKLKSHYPIHPSMTFGMAGGGGMSGMPGMGGGMSGMQSSMGIPFGTISASLPIGSLEGVYLKHRGIVYTATLASLPPPAKVETDSSVAVHLVEVLVQQDSEWERVRRQVRNEKEKPKKPEASKPLSLSDVLLKVLAENGHNFSQLGENESLTLVLTAHEANRSSPARKSGGGGKGGSAKPSSQSPKPASGSDSRGDVSDRELLGDLHQKQGRHDEAIPAFQRAVELNSDPNTALRLYRKLAQCYLALGEDEKARTAVEHSTALLKKLRDAKDGTSPTPAGLATPALPVKLIISAPKKLLDQVKAGKITYEEFRRQAHVETLRFDARR